MKKAVAVIMAALMATAVLGCSKTEPTEDNTPVMISGGQETAGDPGDGQAAGADTASDGYAFESNGTRVILNAPAGDIIASLGDGYDYFEAQSCAFQGMDRVYTYPSFLVRTYEREGNEYILAVEFSDDTVTTPEGIYIGCTADQVIAAYGESTSSDEAQLTYDAAGGELDFIMSDGVVSAIAYNAAT